VEHKSAGHEIAEDDNAGHKTAKRGSSSEAANANKQLSLLI